MMPQLLFVLLLQGVSLLTVNILPGSAEDLDIINSTATPAKLQCGLNEVKVNCPNACPSEECPIRPEDSKSLFCTRPTNSEDCAPPQCRCRQSFRRIENGTCIDIRSCPPFDCSKNPNEEYNACPTPGCSESCSVATAGGKCHIDRRSVSTDLLLTCSPQCRCIEDHWRKNGVCVPYAECDEQNDTTTIATIDDNATVPDASVTESSNQNSTSTDAVSDSDSTEKPSLHIAETYVVIYVTQSRTIHCYLDKAKKDRVDWISPSGDKVGVRSLDRLYVDRDDDNYFYTLFISSAKLTDSGNWTCKSGNLSDTVEIIVGEKSVMPREFEEIHADIGKSQILTCQKTGIPEPTVTWYKDTQILDYSSILYLINENKYVLGNNEDDTYTLEIRNLTWPEDSGEYRCDLTQKALHHYTRKTFSLVVEYPLHDDSTKVQTLSIAESYFAFNVGEKIYIKCTVNLIEDPVEWLTPLGDPVGNRSDSRVSVFKEGYNYYLMISYAEMSDSGVWFCKTDDFSDSVEIKVGVKAEVGSEFEEMQADEGTMAALSCEASGFPEPTVTWYKGNSTVDTTGTAVPDASVTESFNPDPAPQDDNAVVASSTVSLGTAVPDASVTESFNPDPAPQDGTQLKCPKYEILDKCPTDCELEFCAKNREEAEHKSCTRRKPGRPCPPPKCKCGFNKRRDINGTCVTMYDCPSFECNGPFEEYNPCPSCPGETCAEATPDGHCSPLFGPLILTSCEQSCRCIWNYWRKNGVCVPFAECGKENDKDKVVLETSDGDSVAPVTLYVVGPNNDTVKLQCGINEVQVNCPNACSSEVCPKEPEASQSLLCHSSTKSEDCAPPQCRCKPNFRRAENGTCIDIRSCPPFDCSTNPNERYHACPTPGCFESCSVATAVGKCHLDILFGKIKTLQICNPQCRCIEGYWRKNGICVPYAACPKRDFVASNLNVGGSTSETKIADDRATVPDASVPESFNPNFIPADAKGTFWGLNKNCVVLPNLRLFCFN